MNTTQIEHSHVMKALFSNIQDILRNFLNRSSFKCRSEFEHKFSLRSFDNKVWQYERKQLVNQSASSIPFILNTPFFIIAASIFGIKKTSKCFKNPLHYFFIGINCLKSRIITYISKLCFPSADVDSSFAINEASKIRNLFRSPHRYPYSFCFKCIKRVVICHRERLNPETSENDDMIVQTPHDKVERQQK